MATAAEAAYRRLLVALWVLVRTAGSPAAVGGIDAAAADCRLALREAIADEPHVIVQERGGALFVNGLRIRPDVANFAAIAGCIELLQRRRIGELLVLAGASAAEFADLARCWCDPGAADLDAALRARCTGILVAQRTADELAAEQQDSGRPAPSQLGAVFTMQQFTSLLGPVGPLSGRRARAVLQAVLHGLLRSPRGLEPLAGVRHDPAANVDALRACVLAVRAAEELGWGQDRCIAAGTLALLGGAAAVDGEPAVVDLARAARTVVAMLAAADQPEVVLATLQQSGRLSAEIAAAMTSTLLVAVN